MIRLLHYLSQQQQNQGQNKLTSNVMAVITYLDDIIVIVNRNLILSESRGAIESSLDRETVAAVKELLTRIEKKSKMVSNLTFCFTTQSLTNV